MTSRLTPLQPSKYIKTHKPAVEPRKDVSKWFKDEFLELNFGEYVGRPNENILLHKEYLTRFLENGWTVDAVLSVSEGGEWEHVSAQTSDTETGRDERTAGSEVRGNTSTTSSSGNSSSTQNVSGSSSSSNSSSTSSSDSTNTNNESSNRSKTESNSEEHSEDVTTSSSSSTSESSSKSKTKQESSSSSSSSKTSSSSRSSSNGTTENKQDSSSKSNSETNSDRTSKSKSSTSSDASSSGSSSSSGNQNSSSSSNGNNEQSTTTTVNENNSTNSSTSGSESSGSNSATTESGTSTSRTQTKSSGAAYWYAYQRIRLKRRRMQPELVLQDMVTSFTNEYNSGRSIDSQRYGELVSLYSVVLNNTEDELNNLLVRADDLSGLFGNIYESIKLSLTSANNLAAGLSSKLEADAIADIERQFNSLVSQRMSEMISSGMYNSVVWSIVEAGILRQKEAAVVKAKADAAKASVDAHTNVASVKGSVLPSLISVRQTMADAKDKRLITATELRNNVAKWMIDYAGSREEVYPSLEEVSAVAQNLGFSIGAAGNVL